MIEAVGLARARPVAPPDRERPPIQLTQLRDAGPPVRGRPVPLTAGPTLAAPGSSPDAPPLWLQNDLQRGASWLPARVRAEGLAATHGHVMSGLPPDVQAILREQRIPSWMIALVPIDSPGQRDEIIKQLRFTHTLAGPPPAGPVAARAEQLLMFAGAAQLPTPGDVRSGASLRDEGCTAAMCRYVFSPLRAEFPERLAALPNELFTCQSNVEMLRLLRRPGLSAIVDIQTRAFSTARPADFEAGSIAIAVKPGGTHVMGWSRVAAGWNWSPTARMAIGNTGLPQFGARMILAQEYVTEEPHRPGELTHNAHGPITSTNAVRKNGRVDLSDPRTNPYGALGASFTFVRFRG